MPLELLKTIADKPLPLKVTDRVTLTSCACSELLAM